MLTDRQQRALTAANLIVALDKGKPQLDQVAKIVLAAMHDEAEACAVIALRADLDHPCEVDLQIARAIRARSNPST